MPQQVPVSKKVVVPMATPALTDESGVPGLVFISQLGEAFVFPLEGQTAPAEIIKLLLQNIKLDDDDKKQVMTLLTGGLITASAQDLAGLKP